MIIELILKTALLGIFAAVFSTVLSDKNKEYAVLLRLSAVVTITLFAVFLLKDKLSELTSLLSDIIAFPDMITILLKGVIVSLVTSVCSDICIEIGSKSISKTIQLSGRVIIFIISYPLLETIITMAFSFAGG